jgi:hypothetical protein
LSSSSKFHRKDLSQFFDEKISKKMKQEYTLIRDVYIEENSKDGKAEIKPYSRGGELPIIVLVGNEEKTIEVSKA